MWGCILAAAITFPLVWGRIHVKTVPGNTDRFIYLALGAWLITAAGLCVHLSRRSAARA